MSLFASSAISDTLSDSDSRDTQMPVLKRLATTTSPAVGCTQSPFRFVFLSFYCFAAVAMLLSSGNTPDAATPLPSTDSLLTFLQQLQSDALDSFGPTNFDPKFYVDLPLKHNLSTTLQAFHSLPRSLNNNTIEPSSLKSFIDSYFDSAGSDLVVSMPDDFVPEPEGFLPKVKHPEVRRWALEVHSLWRNLSRRVADEVVEKPELHTLLSLLEPVVVPGSRFREVYYWDSYWTIRGLLASKMFDTAKAIVQNLVSLIEKYGFVLNGARSYYTNRSQPPLLSSMVLEIYKRTGDLELVKKSIPLLLKEHNFWTSGPGQKVLLLYELLNSKYKQLVENEKDKESASALSDACAKQRFYRELASTAESGWDFSSRWMRNSSELTTLATTSILPVDLNAYILKMELDLSFLAKVTGDKLTSAKFVMAAKGRHAAMESIFWNPEMDQWLDYWLLDDNDANVHQANEEKYCWESKNQNKHIFASNFVPLWIEMFNSDGALVHEVVQSIKSSGLIREAGIATSLTNSGQQWDYPNGWAPLQHIIVEGLVKSGLKESRSLAEDLAIRWIKTSYAAYMRTGTMHEKYDVEKCGSTGGGGEYKPQTGFGWSNGVVLAFLEEFGWPSDREISCS